MKSTFLLRSLFFPPALSFLFRVFNNFLFPKTLAFDFHLNNNRRIQKCYEIATDINELNLRLYAVVIFILCCYLAKRKLLSSNILKSRFIIYFSSFDLLSIWLLILIALRRIYLYMVPFYIYLASNFPPVTFATYLALSFSKSCLDLCVDRCSF